jgi:hypothetical protein
MNIDKHILKIRKLPQYRNASEEEVRKVAYLKSIEHEINVNDLFSAEEDVKLARNFLKRYLEDFTPETVSDINTLRSIIFLEITNIRLQNQINMLFEAKKDISQSQVKIIHENLATITNQKASIGIIRDKKQEDSAITVMQRYKKQFRIWAENNQASRTCTCPYCGQLFALYMKSDIWESKKHPFFVDRILGNKALVDCYLKNRPITKEDLANIFETSNDYVDWLIKKWKLTHYRETTDLNKYSESLESVKESIQEVPVNA